MQEPNALWNNNKQKNPQETYTLVQHLPQHEVTEYQEGALMQNGVRRQPSKLAAGKKLNFEWF